MNMRKKDFKKLSKKEQFNLIWDLMHDETRPKLRSNTILKFKASAFPKTETCEKEVYSEKGALEAYVMLRALCSNGSISDVDGRIIMSEDAQFLIVVSFGDIGPEGSVAVTFSPLGTTLKKTHPILFLKDSRMDLKVIYDEDTHFVAKNIWC